MSLAAQELWDRSFVCISEARPHLSHIYRHFPQLLALIKGGEKITYNPKLQQQRLGFSFQSNQQGGLIQMLIAGPELATKRGRHFSLQMTTRPLLRPKNLRDPPSQTAVKSVKSLHGKWCPARPAPGARFWRREEGLQFEQSSSSPRYTSGKK